MSECTKARIERRRGRIKGGYICGLMSERMQLSALDEIERLQAENEKLRSQQAELIEAGNEMCHFSSGFEDWKPLVDKITGGAQ